MKICSIICVTGFSAAFVFGYLALSSAPAATGQIFLATVIAGAGFLAGTLSYLKISRELC